MALLEANNITKTFGGLTAVNDVTLTIDEGRIVSVIGPNGAGKTTFFNILTGIYKPDKGTITFGDKPIAGLKSNDIAALGMRRTFQNIRLFNNMTVLENVLVGMHTHLRVPFWHIIFKLPTVQREERKARERAREHLNYVGLDDKREELAKNLPYGDQRRLEIARALAGEPRLILLDEPTAGMNPNETAAATTLIRRLRDDLQLTVVLIEHDMRLVMAISERITVLDYGTKIAEGDAHTIRTNPRVIEAYLGKGAADAA
ncbi:ABC transporter ATP-binding protein [Candidatus Viridilinea mediisalina]|uniref:ABC transporter ATP-binding protein n=1 Tax=Candidatus Viridilinea mediisalina TaxID=2024553 RepID=A0A2A6RGM6_9CHLR|nr:ABC transporter ATP-binding protein [Candidatus Viridilinea mediisalina]PDW02217.1 ABC transporter ATP-binding protein [Candidatus Viridilinea mediisalina]